MSLKDELIKLGERQPDLQNHIRPVLDRLDRTSNVSREDARKHMVMGGKLKDAVEEAIEQYGFDGKDKRALDNLLDQFREGNMDAFLRRYERLETILREAIPREVVDHVREFASNGYDQGRGSPFPDDFSSGF